MRISEQSCGKQRSRPCKLVLAVSTLAVTLAACAEPKLTRRWDTRVDELPKGVQAPTVEISAFTLDPEGSSSSKTVFDMSGEGQAALVNALAASGKLSAAELRQALSKKIAGPSKVATDFSTVRRRLVVDVRRDPVSEAERFVRTSTIIELVDANAAEFTGFEKFATRYETVDLGSLKFDQVSGFKGEASLTPPSPTVTGINLTGSYETTLSEEVVLKRRIAAINPHFAPDQIRIDQEGETGRDLVGNQVIDLTIRAKNLTDKWVSNLDEFDPASAGDNAQVAITRIKIPTDGCTDIEALVSLSSTVRMVLHGQATFTESDDKVFHADVSTSASAGDASPSSKVTLVPKTLLRRSTWEIRDPSNSGHAVLILDDNGNFTPLRLSSFAEAKSVLKWLKQHRSGTLGKRTLEVGGILKSDDPAGYASNIGKLAVWINRLNWSRCP